MKKFLLSLVLLLSVSLAISQTKKETVIIEPYKSVQYYEHFKRMVLNSDDTDLEFVEGFDFEWGYHYEIKVKKIDLKMEYSDGTRYEFDYIKEVSKTKVDDDYEFVLFLTNNRYYHEGEEGSETIEKIDENTYLYFEEVNIIVSDELLPEFEKIVSGEIEKRGMFGFKEDGNIVLKKMF